VSFVVSCSVKSGEDATVSRATQRRRRHIYAKRPYGVRRPCCSRLAFQIWPHVVQRQYVDALTSLLVVVTSRELQNGHGSSDTVVLVGCGWVYT
jgi:hypothetical protein